MYNENFESDMGKAMGFDFKKGFKGSGPFLAAGGTIGRASVPERERLTPAVFQPLGTGSGSLIFPRCTLPQCCRPSARSIFAMDNPRPVEFLLASTV